MTNPYDPNSSDSEPRPSVPPPPPPPRPGGPAGSGEPGLGDPGYGQPAYGQPAYGQPAYAGGGAPLGRPPAAGMGARLGARIIDALILAVPGFFLFAITVGAATTTLQVDPATGEPTNPEAFGAWIGSILLLSLLYGVVALVYEVAFIALKGATPGKMALGLKVLDHDTGQLIGWGRSFVRWVIPYVASFLCGIGQLVVYLSPFFDASGLRRGWHDKAAGDVVVTTR